MPEGITYRELRLVLGDQLNPDHSWFRRTDDSVLYVMMEVIPEATYVKHHIQKIVGVFQAMREFSSSLREAGHRVCYYRIGDPENKQSFEQNLRILIDRYAVEQTAYQEPDEYRLDRLLEKVFRELPVKSMKVSTEHFFTERLELQDFFKGKKQYLMETFYRYMRKKHGVLMDSTDRPATGKWNYDRENRKRLPQGHIPPDPLLFGHDTRDILDEIRAMNIPSFGSIDAGRFVWPKSRKESMLMLDYFVSDLLPHFGTYQDALTDSSWSVYHSRLSFALNLKMIHPAEVVARVEEAWRNQPDRVSIAQAEGFIRQIMGWREYMRGIYWAKMPGYAARNFFGNRRKLPGYFWTGDTRMNCLKKAVGQSLEHAYAHHIQRLMVTGNFCSLAGIDPDEVDRWYLGIYIDAFEWVEITNTRGMSQFADGGIVGTKPYVSSASYIHKMGDHCSECHYDPKAKTGDRACPFNSLYWHFVHRHRARLSGNPRMRMMYRVLDDMEEGTLKAILQQAETYLSAIESL